MKKEDDEAADEVAEERVEETTDKPEHRDAGSKLWASVRKPRLSAVAIMLVVVVSFMLGTSYRMLSSMARMFLPSSSSPDKSPFRTSKRPRKSGKSGCELYPNEHCCKKSREASGESAEAMACIAPHCFANRGDSLKFDDEAVLRDIPFDCQTVDPFGLINLANLQGKPLELKPVTEIPSAISEHYEENKGFSTKSALFTFLIVAKANGETPEDLSDNPELAAMVRDLSLSLDGGLNKEELKAAAQMLGIYNSFVKLLRSEVQKRRAKIKKECAGYKDDLVPIRCLAVAPKERNPYRKPAKPL